MNKEELLKKIENKVTHKSANVNRDKIEEQFGMVLAPILNNYRNITFDYTKGVTTLNINDNYGDKISIELHIDMNTIGLIIKNHIGDGSSVWYDEKENEFHTNIDNANLSDAPKIDKNNPNYEIILTYLLEISLNNWLAE